MNGPVCVAILTTTSVVTIQRVAAETRSRRSVMCIDRRANETGVSRSDDYDRFVSPGTGVIANLTGVGVFRMDVDSDVTEGRSFHLAAFLAHQLQRAGRLAGSATDAGLAELVVATGEVDIDHRVRRVDRIPEKLAVLRRWLDSHPVNCPVRVLVPLENEAETSGLLDGLGSATVTVRFVADADTALSPGGQATVRMPPAVPGGRLEPPGLAPRGQQSSRLSRGVAVAALCALLVAAALWTWTRPAPPGGGDTGGQVPSGGADAAHSEPTREREPSPPVERSRPLRVSVQDVYATGGSCFVAEERMEQRHEAGSDGSLALPARVHRCRLEVSGSDDGGAARYAYLVRSDGQSVSPMYLGVSGSILSHVQSGARELEIAFASATGGDASAIARQPHVVIRVAARPAAGD